MDILPATLRDLGSLRRIEQACFPKDAWPLLDLMAVLTWPEVIRLKAVADGQMVGFIAGDPRRTEGVAWIATLGVLPDYRRQGIARALLQECEKKLNAPACDCVCGWITMEPSDCMSRKVICASAPGRNITTTAAKPW